MERLSLLPISRFVYCTCTLVVKGSKNLLASVRVYPNILYLILCLGIVARLSASPSPQLLPSSPAARWCGTMSGVCVWSCRNQAVCAHKTRAHTRTSEVTRIVTMNIGTDSSLSLLPLNAIHSEDEGESHQESSIEPSMSSHESPRWRSLCSGETEGLKSTADAIQQDYEVQKREENKKEIGRDLLPCQIQFAIPRDSLLPTRFDIPRDPLLPLERGRGLTLPSNCASKLDLKEQGRRVEENLSYVTSPTSIGPQSQIQMEQEAMKASERQEEMKEIPSSEPKAAEPSPYLLQRWPEQSLDGEDASSCESPQLCQQLSLFPASQPPHVAAFRPSDIMTAGTSPKELEPQTLSVQPLPSGIAAPRTPSPDPPASPELTPEDGVVGAHTEESSHVPDDLQVEAARVIQRALEAFLARCCVRAHACVCLCVRVHVRFTFSIPTSHVRPAHLLLPTCCCMLLLGLQLVQGSMHDECMPICFVRAGMHKQLMQHRHHLQQQQRQQSMNRLALQVMYAFAESKVRVATRSPANVSSREVAHLSALTPPHASPHSYAQVLHGDEAQGLQSLRKLAKLLPGANAAAPSASTPIIPTDSPLSGAESPRAPAEGGEQVKDITDMSNVVKALVRCLQSGTGGRGEGAEQMLSADSSFERKMVRQMLHLGCLPHCLRAWGRAGLCFWTALPVLFVQQILFSQRL